MQRKQRLVEMNISHAASKQQPDSGRRTTGSPSSSETLSRYWQLFDVVSTEQVPAAAASVFTETAKWKSERLYAPIRGREEIVRHIQSIRQAVGNGKKTRYSVNYNETESTASWNWTVRQDDGSSIEGTDKVVFAPDGRIQQIQIQAKDSSSFSSSFSHELSSSSSVIRVDGSQGEGGGQILRNAIVYATLLHQTPVEIFNIRANRSKPGLRPQHMTGLRLCRDIAGGTLVGDDIGSSTVRYDPPSANHNGRNCVIGDTKTAGSICLLLQAALPCALFASAGRSDSDGQQSEPIQLELRGGTNAALAPQIDYLTEVFLPLAKARFGLPDDIVIDIQRRGFFPKGGGVVKVSVPPHKSKLKPISLVHRGQVTGIRIRSFYAGKCPRWVSEKMANAAVRELRQATDLIPTQVNPSVEIVLEPNAIDSASGVLVIAQTDTGCVLAGSALGRPKVKPYVTGKDAAEELLQTLRAGGCVDGWLQDQLILYMALADGTSEVMTGCLTLHTRTAIDIAEHMTKAKFEVMPLSTVEFNEKQKESNGSTNVLNVYGTDGFQEGQHLIRCHGVGFMADM